VFATDVSKATVVTLYLLPPIVQALRPRLLAQLRPGSRIVSHDFPFEGWAADEQVSFFAPEKNDGRGGDSTVYLYVVPAQVHGRWALVFPGTATGDCAASGSGSPRPCPSGRADRRCGCGVSKGGPTASRWSGLPATMPGASCAGRRAAWPRVDRGRRD
jgi:hypothetical protein